MSVFRVKLDPTVTPKPNPVKAPVPEADRLQHADMAKLKGNASHIQTTFKKGK